MSAVAGFLTLAAALAAAGFAVARAARREGTFRREILDDCAGVLDGAEPSVAASGFGVLRGAYLGRRAALTPISEALAFRKLPQLWLAAAIADGDPDRPSIEVLRRPGEADSFVGGSGLTLSVRPPESWPQDTRLRISPDAAPLLAAIEAALAPALEDPRLKAVTVGPRGVRVVRQVAQGERGSYLLFRDARFGVTKISPDDARLAISLAAIVADLAARQEGSEHRDAA